MSPPRVNPIADYSHNSIDIVSNFSLIEPQEMNATLLQPFLSFFIVFKRLIVIVSGTIDLDRKHPPVAKEIDDAFVACDLPVELEAEGFTLEFIPKKNFSERAFFSQFAGELSEPRIVREVFAFVLHSASLRGDIPPAPLQRGRIKTPPRRWI